MDTAGTPYEWRVSSEAGKGWMSRMRQLYAQRAAGSHQKRVVAAPVEHSHLPLAVSPHDALNAKEWVTSEHLPRERIARSCSDLDGTLALDRRKGTEQQRVDGADERGRGWFRNTCLGEIGIFSQT